MIDMEKVIKGLECRLDINGSKYKHCLNCNYRHDIDHCQWACQTDGILEDALALLKAQEARHRFEVHNIGNVDIPEGVSWEQFHAVMNNVVDALEHTDRGESWPYEEVDG